MSRIKRITFKMNFTYADDFNASVFFLREFLLYAYPFSSGKAGAKGSRSIRQALTTKLTA